MVFKRSLMIIYWGSNAAETLPLERLGELPEFSSSDLAFFLAELAEMAQILVHGSNRSWGFSWLWTSWTVLLCTDTDNICNIPPWNFGILRSWLRQFAITPWQELIGCTQPRACQKQAAPVSISMDQLDQWHVKTWLVLASANKKYSQVLFKAIFLPLKSHFSLTTCHGSSHGYLVVKGQLAGQVPMHGKVTAKNSCVLGVTPFGIETAVETINRWYVGIYGTCKK